MVFFSLLPYTTIFDAILPHGKAHPGPCPQSTPHGKAHPGNRYLTEKRSLARAPRAHLTEKRILHMTAHSTSPSGTVELCKPGARFRALRRALPLRTSTARLSVTYRRPVPPAHLRPSPALPCGLRTHQCPPARSAARTRAPQPRPTYARKETDHEGIRATA